MDFYLDAKGTDGTDPVKIDRVYADGTRIPSNDTVAIKAHEDKVAARDKKVQDAIGDAAFPKGVRDAIEALQERIADLEAKDSRPVSL